MKGMVRVFVGNYETGMVMDKVVSVDDIKECIDDFSSLLGLTHCAWAVYDNPYDAENYLEFAAYMVRKRDRHIA